MTAKWWGKRVTVSIINAILPLATDIYCKIFGFSCFASFNKFTLTASARCLGVGNYKTPYASGETLFSRRFLNLFDTKEFSVIDVGANIGDFTLYILESTRQTNVISIEPNPLALQKLKTRTFSYQSRQLSISTGLGESQSEMTLYGSDSTENNSHASLYKEAVQDWKFAGQQSSQIKINISTLDSIVSNLNIRPSLIKIDVEGHEYNVLKGCKRLLENPNKRPACFVIEFNEMNLYSGASMFKIQSILGEEYIPFRILPGGKLLPLIGESHLLKELYGYQNIAFILKQHALQRNPLSIII